MKIYDITDKENAYNTFLRLSNVDERVLQRYIHEAKYGGSWDIFKRMLEKYDVRPAFKKDGRVTAGNASSINDGAAAVVVMSEEKAKELGIKPMATWVAGALGGVDPSIMGIGPVAATKKVLKKTGWKVEDFDLIEANEAFAAQSIAVARDLGFNKDILNVNGGAIAIGHPVGASGCRILTTLLYEMQKRDAKKGLATLCIGGGMGCATIVERD